MDQELTLVLRFWGSCRIQHSYCDRASSFRTCSLGSNLNLLLEGMSEQDMLQLRDDVLDLILHDGSGM